MPSDLVRIICPNLKCRAILSVPGSARGKTVRCRQCGVRVRVPDTGVPSEKPAVTATSAEKGA